MMVKIFDFEISEIHLKIAEISNFQNRAKQNTEIFVFFPKFENFRKFRIFCPILKIGYLGDF